MGHTIVYPDGCVGEYDDAFNALADLEKEPEADKQFMHLFNGSVHSNSASLEEELESLVISEERRIWLKEPNAVVKRGIESRMEETIEDISSKVKDNVNPSHYQGYCKTMQWLETQQWLSKYHNNPKAWKLAVELQVRKYLDRLGEKDEEVQEMKKARWYLTYLIKFEENGCVPLSREQFQDFVDNV